MDTKDTKQKFLELCLFLKTTNENELVKWFDNVYKEGLTKGNVYFAGNSCYGGFELTEYHINLCLFMQSKIKLCDISHDISNWINVQFLDRKKLTYCGPDHVHFNPYVIVSIKLLGGKYGYTDISLIEVQQERANFYGIRDYDGIDNLCFNDEDYLLHIKNKTNEILNENLTSEEKLKMIVNFINSS